MHIQTTPIEIELQVTQFVRLESAAFEGRKTARDLAAIILAKRVVPTPAAKRRRACANRRAGRDA